MDAGYFSAIAALSGSAIGGLTSLAASWLSQNAQARAQQHIRNLGQRQELYRAFIEEASRLYARALESNKADIAEMVGLYAMASRMRVLSSPAVSEAADGVVRLIIERRLRRYRERQSGHRLQHAELRRLPAVRELHAEQ